MSEKAAKKELQKRGKLVIAKKFGGVPSLEVTDAQLGSLRATDQDAVRALQEHDRKKLLRKSAGGPGEEGRDSAEKGEGGGRASLKTDTAKVTRAAEGDDMTTPRGLRAAIEKRKGSARRRASAKKEALNSDDERGGGGGGEGKSSRTDRNSSGGDAEAKETSSAEGGKEGAAGASDASGAPTDSGSASSLAKRPGQSATPALECCWRSYITCVGRLLGCAGAGGALMDPMVIELERERLSLRKASILADIEGDLDAKKGGGGGGAEAEAGGGGSADASEAKNSPETPTPPADAVEAKREAARKLMMARREKLLAGIDWAALLPDKYRKAAGRKGGGLVANAQGGVPSSSAGGGGVIGEGGAAAAGGALSPKHHKFRPSKAITAIEIKSVNTFAGDPYVSHPMVRVFAVDARTGELLLKTKPKRPAVQSNGESSTVIGWAFSHGEWVAQRGAQDTCKFVLPVMTRPARLQTSGKGPVGKGADWNEELLLNFHPSLLLQPHVLLLAEIVDFGSKIPLPQLRRGRGLYSIAWGFLYPTGFDGAPNLGSSLRMKLWRYQEPTSMQLAQAEGMGIRTGYGRIPEVYLQFLSSRRIPFGGYLHMAVFPRMKPSVTVGPTRPESVFHAEKSEYKIPTLAEIKVMQREQLEKGKEMSEFEARASEVDGTEVALQRLRKEGEACVVPNTFFKKIGAGRRVGGGSSSSSKSGSESNGCVALRISPSGNFIAASFARNDPRMSQVLIFSTAQGAKLVRWLCGHTDLVHHLTWVYPSTPMPKVVDRDLCSASADGTVRLWRMDNPVETELAENAASESSSRKKGKKRRKKHKNPLQIGSKDGVPMFRAAVVLRHPLQVYVFCFERHPKYKDYVGVSGASDGALRLWDLSDQSGQKGGLALNNTFEPRCLGILVGGSEYNSQASTKDREAAAEQAKQAEATSLNETLRRKQEEILKPVGADAVAVHTTHINAVCFDKRGQKMFTADGAGRLNLWRISGDVRDPASYICLRQIARDLIGSSIFCLRVHPIRGFLLVLAQNSILRMYDSHTPYESIAQFSGVRANDAPLKCCFSPDGRYVLAGSDDGSACLWKTPNVVSKLELTTAQPVSEAEAPCWQLTFSGPVSVVDWSRTEHLLAVGAFGPHNPVVLFTGRRPLNPEDLSEVLRVELEQERAQAEAENALMQAALAYANKERMTRESQQNQPQQQQQPPPAAANGRRSARKPSVTFADMADKTTGGLPPSSSGGDVEDSTTTVGALIPKPSLSEHDRTIIKRMQNLAQSVSATVDLAASRGGGGGGALAASGGLQLPDTRPLNERVADVIARLKSGRRLFKSRDDPDTSDDDADSSPTRAARAGVGTSLGGGHGERRGTGGAAGAMGSRSNSMEGVAPFGGVIGGAVDGRERLDSASRGHGRLGSMAGAREFSGAIDAVGGAPPSSTTGGRPPLQQKKLRTEDGPTLEEKVNTRRRGSRR